MSILGNFLVMALLYLGCASVQAAIDGIAPWVTGPLGVLTVAGVATVFVRNHRSPRAGTWAALRRECGLSRKSVRAARRLGLDPENLRAHAQSCRPEWRSVVEEQVLDLHESRRLHPSGRS